MKFKKDTRILYLAQKVKNIKSLCIVSYNTYFDAHKKQTIEG